MGVESNPTAQGWRARRARETTRHASQPPASRGRARASPACRRAVAAPNSVLGPTERRAALESHGRALPVAAGAPGGPAHRVHVRQAAPETQQNHLHAAAAAGAGVAVPEDPLPRRLPAGGGGAEDLAVGGARAGVVPESTGQVAQAGAPAAAAGRLADALPRPRRRGAAPAAAPGARTAAARPAARGPGGLAAAAAAAASPAVDAAAPADGPAAADLPAADRLARRRQARRGRQRLPGLQDLAAASRLWTRSGEITGQVEARLRLAVLESACALLVVRERGRRRRRRPAAARGPPGGGDRLDHEVRGPGGDAAIAAGAAAAAAPAAVPPAGRASPSPAAASPPAPPAPADGPQPLALARRAARRHAQRPQEVIRTDSRRRVAGVATGTLGRRSIGKDPRGSARRRHAPARSRTSIRCLSSLSFIIARASWS